MGTLNQGWYDANGARAYPLDDAATGTTDDGRELPHGLLVDAQVHCGAVFATPGAVGQLVLGAIRVEAGSVSLILHLVSDSGASWPVAAVALPKPVTPHRLCRLEPLPYSGAGELLACRVGGWVVLGPEVNSCEFSGTFATPAQAALAAGAGRVVGILGSSGVGRARPAQEEPPPPEDFRGVQTLTGLVRLEGAGGLALDVVEHEALFEIVDAEGQAGPPQLRSFRMIRLALDPQARPGILRDMAGPCGGRPDSRTCNRPVVESFGGIEAPCHGMLDVRFPDCEVIPFPNNTGGALLVYDVGLEDVCATWRPPALYESPCSSSSSSLGGSLAEDDSVSGPLADGAVTRFSGMTVNQASSFPLDTPAELTDGRGQGTGEAGAGWQIVGGDFAYQDIDGVVAWCATNPARRALAVQPHEQYSPGGAFARRSVEVAGLFPGGTAGLAAGAVLDYRPDTRAFLMLELDARRNRLALVRYNGTRRVTLASLALEGPARIAEDQLFLLRLEARLAADGPVEFTGVLTAPETFGYVAQELGFTLPRQDLPGGELWGAPGLSSQDSHVAFLAFTATGELR